MCFEQVFVLSRWIHDEEPVKVGLHLLIVEYKLVHVFVADFVGRSFAVFARFFLTIFVKKLFEFGEFNLQITKQYWTQVQELGRLFFPSNNI